LYITITVYLQCVLVLLANPPLPLPPPPRHPPAAVNALLVELLSQLPVVAAAVAVVAAVVPSKAVDEARPSLLRIKYYIMRSIRRISL
jgi:hypothetical protein